MTLRSAKKWRYEWGLVSSFRPKRSQLDRMDRKSKLNQLQKWPHVLDSREISGAPGEIRTPDPLLRSYAVQNSKCRFWCRLRGSASFISPLNWTEVGLKQSEVE